jgi:PAS domain-containing protein
MQEFDLKSREELIAELIQVRKEKADLEKIREHERHATICYDNLFQFCGLVDMQGNLLEVNPSALRISGRKFESNPLQSNKIFIFFA